MVSRSTNKPNQEWQFGVKKQQNIIASPALLVNQQPEPATSIFLVAGCSSFLPIFTQQHVSSEEFEICSGEDKTAIFSDNNGKIGKGKKAINMKKPPMWEKNDKEERNAGNENINIDSKKIKKLETKGEKKVTIKRKNKIEDEREGEGD